MNGLDFGGAGGEEAPFAFGISDIRSSVASMVSETMVSSLPEVIHSSNFDLQVLKKYVKS